MAKPLLTDELWEIIKPLLPLEKPRPKGGRPRVPDRLARTGILFMARTGTVWELLPPEFGCGGGMTCWRRFRDWQVSGGWQKVWKAILDQLGMAEQTGHRWGLRCRGKEKMTAEAKGNHPENGKAACRAWKQLGNKPLYHRECLHLNVSAETTQSQV